jgi:hypothetical protein
VAQRDLPRNFHSDEYGGVYAPGPLLLLPAYTLLPFIRSPVGIQLVNPAKVIRRVVGLIVLPFIAEVLWVGFTQKRLPDSMGHISLVAFALAYLIASLVVFARRWYGQHHGAELHSGEAGYSWLVWRTTVPVGACEQVIVPLIAGVLGYAIAHTFSIELGWWLMAAGVSLLIMARWEYRRVWSQHQATVDDLIRAKSYEDRMTRHESMQGGASPASASGPIFADLSDDDAPSRR